LFLRSLPALLSFGLLILTPLPAPGQPARASAENQFDSNITLFTTLAAINAAGYDAGLNTPIYQRFLIRQQIRDELAKKKIPCLSELKDFYRKHQKPDDTANLSQYISFSLFAGPPPNFALPAAELPEDVLALSELSPLLSRFYAEANIADMWKRSQPGYNAAILEYQPTVLKAVLSANAYTRSLNTGYMGRRFQIYIDVLGAPDQIQIRSYKDDYFVVITPTSADLEIEIRDAYLSYLLDPLSLKFSKAIGEKKKLQQYAEQAPALDLIYKDDFSLLVTKCLIKAIDARMMKGDEKRQLAVDQAMREGFILTAAFAEQLVLYEKQDTAMRMYYPDLVTNIDVGKEQKRIRKVEFTQSTSRPLITTQQVSIPEAERTLEAADGLMETKDYDNARKAFSTALSETDSKALHGRAYFGLARVAIVQKQQSQAKELFERALENEPSPSEAAWCHYYLGKLALSMSGDIEKAKHEFEAVLSNDGSSAKVREVTEQALQEISGDKEKNQ
jgi:TolA-binding protein